MSVSWDASEVRKLVADLGGAGPKVRQRAGQVVRKSALDVVALAQSMAPVDTGNLHGSIGMDTPAPLSAVVGPTANYAPYVEWGTHRMAPQPFMGPAADAVEPNFVAAIAAIAKDVL